MCGVIVVCVQLFQLDWMWCIVWMWVYWMLQGGQDDECIYWCGQLDVVIGFGVVGYEVENVFGIYVYV